MTSNVPRILLVEDDPQLRSRLDASLSAAGYASATAASVAEARAVLAGGFDLILLDLGLPDADGLELCRELRSAGDRTPIIVVSARDATRQRVRGLDLGADDFVSKPFQLEELFARVRSVLRRAGHTAQAGRVTFRDLWADPRTRQAGRGDVEIALKPREFDLLLFLLRQPGRVWTRDQLLEHVWGHGFEGESRTVDLHVRRLRAKIEEDPSDPRYIKTVWGVGYHLAETA
ncbi:MAG: response regulator transcription factor [Planctomycetota bacterium]